MKKKNEIVLDTTKGLALDKVFPNFTRATLPSQGWGMYPPLEKICLLNPQSFGIHGMCEETGWRPRA